jgi:hypothetical protein
MERDLSSIVESIKQIRENLSKNEIERKIEINKMNELFGELFEVMNYYSDDFYNILRNEVSNLKQKLSSNSLNDDEKAEIREEISSLPLVDFIGILEKVEKEIKSI